MNLYKVRLRGMKTSASGIAYGDSFVLAEDSNEAYKKVRGFVDKRNLGFRHDRELESIELLAAESEYNDTGKMVFV